MTSKRDSVTDIITDDFASCCYYVFINAANPGPFYLPTYQYAFCISHRVDDANKRTQRNDKWLSMLAAGPSQERLEERIARFHSKKVSLTCFIPYSTFLSSSIFLTFIICLHKSKEWNVNSLIINCLQGDSYIPWKSNWTLHGRTTWQYMHIAQSMEISQGIIDEGFWFTFNYFHIFFRILRDLSTHFCFHWSSVFTNINIFWNCWSMWRWVKFFLTR